MQSQWYLNERGLVWESSDKPVSKKSVPKEPTTGFQLFSNRISADTRNDLQIDPGMYNNIMMVVEFYCVVRGNSIDICIKKLIVLAFLLKRNN